MDGLEEEIKLSLSPSEKINHRRSPGYPNYPISLNLEITTLLDTAKRIGVSTTDSMLLIPSKSVVAICEVIK
jgi:cobalamin-dependent methionine synthase I